MVLVERVLRVAVSNQVNMVLQSVYGDVEKSVNVGVLVVGAA